MAKIIFLSHNAKDKPLATIIATIINEVSSEQIKPWFSSDDQIGGGVQPGENWYNAIHGKISQSDVLVALVTPRSFERPWLYYEAGIAKGLNKVVVPVCIGIEREEMKSPLRELQTYQLTDNDLYEEFLGRTLDLLGLSLDKRKYKGIIAETLLKITRHKFKITANKQPDVLDVVENLKSYIDQKFRGGDFPKSDSKPIQTNSKSEAYSIRFELQFKNDKRAFITEIKSSDTFETITDKIYFNFSDIIDPYTYLEEWVIVDARTGNYLVIREIASRVAARDVFLQRRKYYIKPLSKVYSALDSKRRILDT